MEDLSCRSKEVDHPGMLETVQYERLTVLIFVRLFDGAMLEISNAVTAVVEGQGGFAGNTRQGKFA